MKSHLIIFLIFSIPFFALGKGDSLQVTERSLPTILSNPLDLSLKGHLNDEDKGLYNQRVKPSEVLKNISVGGYYRFYGWHRALKDPFPVLPENQFANTPPYVIGVGDLYRDPPLMLINLGARPSSKSYIGMDYAFYSNFTGNLGTSVANLNLGININGSFRTDVGRFGFQMGGINWVELSSMVFGSWVGYERFSVFDRLPWEGIASGYQRAQNWHELGAVSRDLRFGMQAFKGVLFDAYELPKNMSVRILLGQTPATANLGSTIPGYTAGGRVRWSPKFGQISVNSMNYHIYLDSLATVKGGISLHTISFDGKIKDIDVSLETGLGQLYSPTQDEGVGEAIRFKLKFPKKYTKIPIELEFFQIDRKFVNFYGNFLSFNSQIIASNIANQGIANSGGASTFAGSITDVGQISNNRVGGAINTWLDFDKTNTKVNLGLMVSQEMEIVTDQITWGHKINGLPFSRLVTFSNNVGPYDRWTSYFRGFSQQTTVTDVDTTGLPFRKSGFSTFQIQVKQKIPTKGLESFVFYVGTIGSVGDDVPIFPRGHGQAYLTAHYHEFDWFIPVNSTFDIILSTGWEVIKGNGQTLRGDNFTGTVGDMENSPVDQFSQSGGVGIDINVSDKMGIYARRKWFSQKDRSFTLDDISGTETYIEMKIFF